MDGNNMKKKPGTLVCTALFLAALFSGCGLNFPTRYERIETDRVRSLGFVFDPAEAAPGDTVRLVSYYAGETVDSVHWRISLDYRFDLFGNDTALGTMSLLDTIGIDGSDSLVTGVEGLYDAASVQCVIPRDFIRSASIIPDNWYNLLPEPVRDSLPDWLKDLSKDDLIDFVELLSYSAPEQLDTLMALIATGEGPVPSEALGLVGMLAQLFTAPFVVSCDAWSGGYRYETRSQYMVRYNRLLSPNLASIDSSLDFVKVNHNPRIEWIGVYKVKKDGLYSFDPVKDGNEYDYVLYCLYQDGSLIPPGTDTVWLDDGTFIVETDTVPLEKGCSYFLAADSGAAWKDTSVVVTTEGVDVAVEELYYDWFYQPEMVRGVKPDSIMVINNGFRGNTAALFPPVETARDTYEFSLWVVAYDVLLGDRLRPRGFTFCAAEGVFLLTDDYKKMIDKR